MQILHRQKVPSKALVLLKFLQENGFRIFTRSQLQDSLPGELRTLSYQAISNLLLRLVKAEFIQNPKKRLYINHNTSSPIYEQEIAMYLLKPAMISHRSAFRYHNLTDQNLVDVTMSTVKGVFIPQCAKGAGFIVNNITYRVIALKEQHFFGHEIAWKGESKFKVSDIEKTLLDGLSIPTMCGGFSEVIWAFEENIQKINLDKIIEYAMRMDTATSRRLGYVLNKILKLDLNMDKIICLAKAHEPGYRLLDASRKDQGEYCREWMIRINHFGG